jgi:sugar lactone lactonase YvrE
MKTAISIQTTRRALRDSLFCVWLWVLAVSLPLTVLGQLNYATPYTFTTFAGNNGYGSADGTNSGARFSNPYDVAVDTNGNLFVADFLNDTVRKVTPIGTNWVVTTLAGLAGVPGSADGTGSAARFNGPAGVAADNAGNIYVADEHNDTIRKLTPVGTNWVVTTLAGLAGVPGSANGTGSAARFYHPGGVAVDSAGNVYVADEHNDTIRKVTPAGVVTTLAGLADVSGSADGRGSAARFSLPFGVAVDSEGNVYVADQLNSTIRKVTPVGTEWDVTTLAGQAGSFGTNDGTGNAARFSYVDGVAVDSAGNLYVADQNNSTIRQLTPDGTNWDVTTLAGQAGSFGFVDGTGSAARFYITASVAVDSTGNLYVADQENNAIREVTPGGVVTTLAGLTKGGAGSADGTGRGAQFDFPVGVAVDSTGNLYVGDQNNHTIREVTPAGVVTTLAGQAGVPGNLDGTGTNSLFSYPDGVAVDGAGNLYVADSGNGAIRILTPTGTNWTVSTLATGFNNPNGVAVDTNGNVYVGDSGNNAIEQVTPSGMVTTLATGFNFPFLVAVDSAGIVYVADSGHNAIRKVTPVGTNWVVTTLAGCVTCPPGFADGTGNAARFNNPVGVAVDANGNVYVSDGFNSAIRKVTPTGVVTTLAGAAVFNYILFADGTGTNAEFNYPYGLAVDSSANVYVADGNNETIRKGFLASAVPPPNLQPPGLSTGPFGFGITGLSGLALNIESSGDLSHWEVIGTSILAGGTNNFVSPTQPQGAQFYRSRVR